MLVVNDNNTFTVHNNQEELNTYLEVNYGVSFKTYNEFYPDATYDDWYQTLDIIVNEATDVAHSDRHLFTHEKYLSSLVLLNQFDSNSITPKSIDLNDDSLDLAGCQAIIDTAREDLIDLGEATYLFGQDKDNRLDGIINNIYQTWDGNYLYDTINKRAAFLFYSIVKNHPFSDGNKRIGALLFLVFLEKHKISKADSLYKFNQNGIVALTILIAQSNPDDKDLILDLIANMIGDN